ncbi:YtpI family protein [Paenibacillus xerothermodurans]|uniref:YtpI-like protein n=1 Tax=Paenibacillus xerothermodurans TaxID=1977292 RepID=A0A2W1NRF6_PAEXE|nr:YtpI family protein [Paenibacillus xerothermodurans]PZE21463.1 hypothetical protein CBW46_008950 [Paenibacillus xerothermodurans]
MLLALQALLLPILIFVPLCFSVYYSVRSRRSEDPKQRGLLTAKMNIAMGIMLVVIAVAQLFFVESSNTSRVFGTICVLLGLFNLFAGMRNYSQFSRM